MPVRLLMVRLVFIISFLLSTLSLPAEEQDQQPNQLPSASIQHQLDELKEGQRRLFKELDELKQLLQQKPALTNLDSKATMPKVASVDVYGEPFRGTNTARIAIIEYSDFNCSFCGKYSRGVFPRIDKDYVKTGKIRYFFRDLPERDETNAWLKARAARCAGDQGKFWEMHDRLFAEQSVSGQDLATLARALGLDVEEFSKCLSAEKYEANIQRSVDGARRIGIFGTPAFLIGTVTQEGDFVWVKRVLVGAQTYEALRAILDELLAETPQKTRNKGIDQ
jgi:protein-disulfide isomerase